MAADHAPLDTLRLAQLRPDDYIIPSEWLDRVMTPALVIYRKHVQHNIAQMINYMGGQPDRWRPHLKTTKTPEIYAVLLRAGLRRFKCATVREARCLLSTAKSEGIDDVDLLIAYPLQGPALDRAGALALEYSKASVAVLSESVEHVAKIGNQLGIFVDVNPGMNRTGIPLIARDKIVAVATAAADRFVGLHFYDGHIHAPDADSRRQEAHALYRQLLLLRKHVDSHAKPCRELITSGTPTFRYALDFAGFDGGRVEDTNCIHTVSPGTVVFHDFQYDELLEDLELKPAAMVLSRVISHPTDSIATCDAGSKSIASEAGNPVAFVLGRPDLVAQPPSEEHLPLLAANPESRPNYGELLLLVPRHVCPTVNLAEQALLIDGDNTRAVDVVARAHELLV